MLEIEHVVFYLELFQGEINDQETFIYRDFCTYASTAQGFSQEKELYPLYSGKKGTRQNDRK